MKQFRKNKDGLYICEECEKEFTKLFSLGIHINKEHNRNLYRKKWILEKDEDKCKFCGDKIKFKRLIPNRTYCSVKCSSNSLIKKEKIKKTNFRKYNGIAPMCSYNIKNKTKQTCLIKYGVKNPMQNKEIQEKVKQTCILKYGVKNPNQSINIRKKIKNTCLKKYGVENVFQSKEIKEKIKQTNLERYGVENSAQNLEIFLKTQKSGYRSKKFKSTKIYYQGSYELDFLEKYYNKYDIQRGPRIKYIFENKERYYFSDFLISSKNLIIEIKNSYLAKRDKLILRKKEKASLNKGYDFIMIIDKDYNKFEKYI